MTGDTEPTKGETASHLSEIEAVRQHTLETLRLYDAGMKETALAAGREHRSLADVWEQSWKIHNTNELLRTNMLQMQVMFQDAIDKIYSRHTDSARRLEEVKNVFAESKKMEDYYTFRELRKKTDDEERVMREDMLKVGRFMKSLFAEYRQAQDSKLAYYHMSDVNLMFGVMIAIIRQEVRQKDQLERLSEKMEEAFERVLGERTPKTIDA